MTITAQNTQNTTTLQMTLSSLRLSFTLGPSTILNLYIRVIDIWWLTNVLLFLSAPTIDKLKIWRGQIVEIFDVVKQILSA